MINRFALTILCIELDRTRNVRGHACPYTTPIDVLGKINVPVEYDGQSEILPLIVVGGDKPALLGRNWLSG